MRRNFSHPLIIKYVKVLKKNSNLVAEMLAIPNSYVIEKLTSIENSKDLSDFLNISRIKYLAPGDARNIQINNCDLTWSYGVLEHIPKQILESILIEFFRISAKNTIHYHAIGTHDHFNSQGLGNCVNFLRYSEFKWKLIAGNRFAYHNRLRRKDYKEMLNNSGFKILNEYSLIQDSDIEILKTMRIDKKFKNYSIEDLACAEFDILIQTEKK